MANPPSSAQRIADSFPSDPLEDGWHVGEEAPQEHDIAEEYEYGSLRSANDLNARLLDERREAREAREAEIARYREEELYERALEVYEGGNEPTEIIEALARVSPNVAGRLLRTWHEDEYEPPTASEYLADVVARSQAARQARLLAEQHAQTEADAAKKRELVKREVERMKREHPRGFERLFPLMVEVVGPTLAQVPSHEAVGLLRDGYAVTREAARAEQIASVRTDMARGLWEDDQWLSGKPASTFDDPGVFSQELARVLPEPETVVDINRVPTREEYVRAARASLAPDEQERHFAKGWESLQNADLHARRVEEASHKKGHRR